MLHLPVIGLLAMGALAIRAITARDSVTGSTSDSSGGVQYGISIGEVTEVPDANGGVIQVQAPANPDAKLSPHMTTADWAETVRRLAPDMPEGFKLAWIEWESGGSVCAWGKPPQNGFVQEAGIAQTNFDTGNRAHGTTSNAHRMEAVGVCSLTSQVQLRAMTQAEADAHAMIALAEMRQGVSAARLSVPNWTGPDFWAVAKSWHGYPGLPAAIARAVAMGAKTFSEATHLVMTNQRAAGLYYGYSNLEKIFTGAMMVAKGLDRAGNPVKGSTGGTVLNVSLRDQIGGKVTTGGEHS